MKKYITALVMAAVLGIVTPVASLAQTRYCDDNGRQSRKSRQYNERAYNNAGYYTNDGYYTQDDYDYGVKKPNVYQRHRKAMNVAIATGAGAILGALLGGKKGALIGAGAGAVGGLVITKKQAPKNYYRY